MKTHHYNKGITLLIAMVVTGTVLLISIGIAVISAREEAISTASRDSQYAFYAADTGAECALYWDAQNLDKGYSAFSPSSVSTIYCNDDGNNPANHSLTVGGTQTSSFTLTFLPQPYCAQVTVVKNPDLTTQIQSLGFNTCAPNATHRVERAVQVTY